MDNTVPLQMKPTDQQLIEMANTLGRMLGGRPGPKDGLGAYLGDGFTQGVPIRTLVLAACLQELLELRQKTVDSK